MTTENDLKAAIAALCTDSLASKLRKVLPEIDSRVREGASHEAIVKFLNANGIPISLSTFRTNLYRWRRTQKLAPEVAGSIRQPPSAVSGATSARVQNKGDLVRLRKETEFDLDELAKAAKGQKE